MPFARASRAALLAVLLPVAACAQVEFDDGTRAGDGSGAPAPGPTYPGAPPREPGVVIEPATEAACIGVPPTASAGLVKRIVAGGASTCALLTDGTVKCWGVATSSPVPATVPGLADVVDIAPGGTHWCALLAGGIVSCWGSNQYGALGDGSADGAATPALVPGLTDVVELAASRTATLARRADGSVYFWGTWHDKDGWAENVTWPTPRQLVLLHGASSLGVGYEAYCAMKDGAVCFGSDQRLSRHDVAGAIAVDPSCALTAEGRVACWAWDERPSIVAGLANVTAISSGWVHSCALTCGRVACWGHNFHGALGNGTDVDREAPSMVGGVDDVVGIATGRFHSCALRADGAVFCWGSNSSGELGDGTRTARRLPVRVEGL